MTVAVSASSAATASRLRELAAARNRALYLDAAVTAVLGVLFCILVFGSIYWTAVVFGPARFSPGGLGFSPLAFAITGVLFVAAFASAWRQVDPLATLESTFRTQDRRTQIDSAASEMVAFSPRHSVAGTAVVLVGGPANILEAIGTLRSRVPAPDSVLEESVTLLHQCLDRCPFQDVQSARAVLLLRKLELIRVVDDARGGAFVIRERGRAVAAIDGPVVHPESSAV